MLVDCDRGFTVVRTIRGKFLESFKTIKSRLTPQEFDAIVEHINDLIEEANARNAPGERKIATAGWLPGAHWGGTPLSALYHKAARKDHALAGQLFGLLVWVVVMDRPEWWGSGRYEKDGRDIGSRTYFEIDPPTEKRKTP